MLVERVAAEVLIRQRNKRTDGWLALVLYGTKGERRIDEKVWIGKGWRLLSRGDLLSQITADLSKTHWTHHVDRLREWADLVNEKK